MTNTIRVATLFAALSITAIAGCSDDVPNPIGLEDPGVCCDCGCSETPGNLCLSVQVEGVVGSSCEQVCALECAENENCSEVESIGTCLSDPTGKGDSPGPGCSELLEDDGRPCEPQAN